MDEGVVRSKRSLLGLEHVFAVTMRGGEGGVRRNTFYSMSKTILTPLMFGSLSYL